jgi:hypothetical protein
MLPEVKVLVSDRIVPFEAVSLRVALCRIMIMPEAGLLGDCCSKTESSQTVE